MMKLLSKKTGFQCRSTGMTSTVKLEVHTAVGLMHQQSTFQIDDIGKVRIDFSLCEEEKRSSYYKFHIIPWQKLNNTTFSLVENISQDINHWIEANYGVDYVLIKADSDQVLSFLNSHFGISEFASNYLYYTNPKFSAKDIKLGSIIYASFFYCNISFSADGKIYIFCSDVDIYNWMLQFFVQVYHYNF